MLLDVAQKQQQELAAQDRRANEQAGRIKRPEGAVLALQTARQSSQRLTPRCTYGARAPAACSPVRQGVKSYAYG